MLRRLIETRIAAEERALGEDLDYLKYMLHASVPGYLRYLRVLSVASYGRVLPVEALHTADLLASRHEGCGNCVRIARSQALRRGVSNELIAAILDGDTAAVPCIVRDVYEFARAILRDQPEQSVLRKRIVDRYGDAALVEVGLRLASGRILPVMTHVLGFAAGPDTRRDWRPAVY